MSPLTDLLAELRRHGGRIELGSAGRPVLRGPHLPADLVTRLREHRDILTPLVRLGAKLGEDLADQLADLIEERLALVAADLLPAPLLPAAALLELVERRLRLRGLGAVVEIVRAIYDAEVELDVNEWARIEGTV